MSWPTPASRASWYGDRPVRSSAAWMARTLATLTRLWGWWCRLERSPILTAAKPFLIVIPNSICPCNRLAAVLECVYLLLRPGYNERINQNHNRCQTFKSAAVFLFSGCESMGFATGTKQSGPMATATYRSEYNTRLPCLASPNTLPSLSRLSTRKKIGGCNEQVFREAVGEANRA